MPTSEKKLESAYSYCMAIAQNHYENFPVASWFLTKELRHPISAVYAFARSADDIADEGDLSIEQRLSYLEEYSSELNKIELSPPTDFSYISNNPIFTALAHTIEKYQIPINLFHDLLTAFKSDVRTHRYNNFSEILDYCKKSANPVGQILLYLNQSASEENLQNSDAICTGLQLINFYQDIQQDIIENDRLYLPLDQMEKWGVSVLDIKQGVNNQSTAALMTALIQQTQELYHSGQALCFNLSGRFAIEIRMIYAGGQLILDKLANNTSAIYQRPRLNRWDKIKILWRGFFP